MNPTSIAWTVAGVAAAVLATVVLLGLAAIVAAEVVKQVRAHWRG